MPSFLYISLTIKTKMKLDRRIFWDVDFDKIDWVKNAPFVIVRVFERGDVDDIRQCRRHHGDEKIREVLLNARYISKSRIYLAAAVIDEPLINFRCYKKTLLNQEHYLY